MILGKVTTLDRAASIDVPEGIKGKELVETFCAQLGIKEVSSGPRSSTYIGPGFSSTTLPFLFFSFRVGITESSLSMPMGSRNG